MDRRKRLGAILDQGILSKSVIVWHDKCQITIAYFLPLQRLCFQAAFTCGLSLIFAVLLVVYRNSLPPFNPRLQSMNNLDPPGLGFRPSPKNPQSDLINFKHGYSSEDWKPLKVSVAIVEYIVPKNLFCVSK